MPRPITERSKRGVTKELITASDVSRVPPVSSGSSKYLVGLAGINSFLGRQNVRAKRPELVQNFTNFWGEREQFFAPEQQEWQRPATRAKSNAMNSAQPRTRFGRRTDTTVRRVEADEGHRDKRPLGRPRARRQRSSSRHRSKENRSKQNQPMISARARKTTSKLFQTEFMVLKLVLNLSFRKI